MQVQSYLFFDGRCEEALDFYQAALGAEITALMRYKDAPPQPESSAQEGCGPGQMAPEKIMHANMQIGETQVMASDGMNGGKPDFKGFALSITAPNENEAHRIFAAIGEGGKVQMPLGETFFARSFGMVTDRFGVSWMVIVPLLDIG